MLGDAVTGIAFCAALIWYIASLMNYYAEPRKVGGWQVIASVVAFFVTGMIAGAWSVSRGYGS